MQYGRIVRVERPAGAIETYVIAEPDRARAVATIRAKVAGEFGKVEPIGRASAALLAEMGLAPTMFAKA